MNVLLLSLLAAVSASTEVVVATTGDDAAAGTAAAPFRTLAHALGVVADGDTITLRGGTYTGNVVVSRNVTIRSWTGERARLYSPLGSGTNLVLSHRSGAVLRDLDFEGGTGYGVDFDSCTDSLMEGCKVWGVDGDLVKVSPGSLRVTIRGCEIFGNLAPTAAEGIDAVMAHYLTVQDTYIHDIQSDGAYAKGGCRFAVFERCVFERCGLNPNTYGAGVLLGQATNPALPFTYENEDGVVRNCIMRDINGAGMGAQGALRPKFYNNTLLNVAKLDRAAIVFIPGTKTACQDVEIRNNIVRVDPSSGRNLVWIYAGGLASGLVADRNRYFGGSGQFLDSRPGGGTFTLAAWQAAYGADAASTIGDPGLDATGHLLAGSFCIDQATTLAGFSDDFDLGTRTGSWDIGADEFAAAGGPVPVPTPVPTPTPTPVPGVADDGGNGKSHCGCGTIAGGAAPLWPILAALGASLIFFRRRPFSPV